MADKDLAALDVDRAVVGKLLEFATDNLVQHAGWIDPEDVLQFRDGVRPRLNRLVLAVDGHLHELRSGGELLDAMLAEIRFCMGRNQFGLAVPEILEDLEDKVTFAPSQVKQLVAGDVGLGPLVVLVVHLDPVGAGMRHRLPVQAAMLNIRKFNFNRSQFGRLNGDCLLNNTQFQVESITIHIVFSVSTACVRLVPNRSRFTGLSAPAHFFRHDVAKKSWAGALIGRQGCSRPSMNDAEYRRLLKMLTLRACRALKIAAAKGEDWILGAGKSPADYAAETLILWGTNQLQFTGTPEKLETFLTKVMTNAIISALRKREVKANRAGKMVPPDEFPDAPSLQSEPENLFDIRSLLRDDAFRKALDQCTAADKALKGYIDAIEIFEDGIPTPEEIASLMGVPVTKVYEYRRKLARRLGKHGFTTSRRRSNV